MKPGEGVRCDLCGSQRIGESGTTYPELRGKLNSIGWLCKGEVDVCPTCRAKRGG